MIRLLVRLVGWVAPRRASEWAAAMYAEIDAIADRRAASRYALGCLWAALILRAQSMVAEGRHGSSTPRVPARLLFIQANSGCGAAAIGVLYLLAAEAPMMLVVVNTAAMLLGVLLVIASSRLRTPSAMLASVTTMAIAAVLLLTAVTGHAVDGVSRWVHVGSLSVQTSLVLLPLAVLLFSLTENRWTTTAMIAMATAVALQPDRAMAFALWVSLSALLFVRRTRAVAIACSAASAAMVATWLQTDPLPAVPFVDHILWSSFRVHPLLGVALWLGAALLCVPLLVLRSADARPACRATGACWAAIVVAAAAGAYPTPVVGYGGAAILGYFLCLAALGMHTNETTVPGAATAPFPDPHTRAEGDADGSHPRVRHRHYAGSPA